MSPLLGVRADESIWPVSEIVLQASSRPSSIEPESPMNMRARWKLCGRKPAQMPAIVALTSEAVVATANCCW